MSRVLLIALLILPFALRAADFYESLQVADRVYQNVYVLSANASSLSIRHSRGLTQAPLAGLAEDIRAKYGYDEARDAQRINELETERNEQAALAARRLEKQVRVATAKRRAQASAAAPAGLGATFAAFGSRPEIRSEVDLREAFRGHGLGVRRQRGPSCSVHAIVAALEFQFAEKRGMIVNVDENDLVRATSRTIGRAPKNALAPDGSELVVTQDEGFALEQVFQAIRGHGLALESVSGSESQEDFKSAISDVAFSPFRIPGGRSENGIGNMIHVLNARMPVVVGVAWPSDWRVQGTSLISKQPPEAGAGHAITLVGYRCPTVRIEDTKFIFRNSWGMSWGTGGYGFITYEFLMNNLFSAYVVELR